MNYPHPGVSGSKPRLSKSAGNGASSKEEFARLSREYLEIRNRGQAAKAYLSETQAARARGELIDKKRALDSGRYIGAVFRQRALLVHREIARQLVVRHLVSREDEHTASMLIDAEVRKLLTEIAHLPEKALDPGWIEEVERKELGLESDKRQPTTPREHQREQARIENRRRKQTASKRKERAKG